MEIQNNLAHAIRTYKELTGKSFAECAAEFDISLTSLKEYAAGRGNPSLETVERIVSIMGIDNYFLITEAYTRNQLVILKNLLGLIGFLEKIPPEKRMQFAELIHEMVTLLNGGDNNV